MTYKELMIKSLSGLLKEGETLLHPIYGIIDKSGEQKICIFRLY